MIGIDLSFVIAISPLLQDVPRDLGHDAGTVTRLSIVVAATAMIITLERLQGLLENRVVPFALDTGNEADTTSVPFSLIEGVHLAHRLEAVQLMRILLGLVSVAFLADGHGVHRQ